MSRKNPAAARPARSAARLAAAGLALAAPLAIAGAALSGAAQATTIPSYALNVSTHTLAFGSVNTGAHLAKTVTVTNTGSKPVQPVKVKSGSKEFSAKGSCTSLAP